MAHKYTITTPTQSVKLDQAGKGTAAFTVTNISGAADRGMGRVVPQGSAKAEWLTIAGNAERDFTPNGVNQYDVNIALPPGAPPGSYSFRFDMSSALRRTGEEYDEGPTVKFEATPIGKDGPKWWIWVAAVVVLAVLGVGAWLVFGRKGDTVEVPDVTQKPFIEAIKTVQAKELKVALTPKKGDPATPGTVVDQDPKSKTKVAKASTVTLTVATKGDADLSLPDAEATQLTEAEASKLKTAVEGPQVATKVKVPSIINLNGDTAMLRIYQAGLVPDPIPLVMTNATPNTVVEQRPVAGKEVDPNSSVTVVIAQAPWRPVFLDPAFFAQASPVVRKRVEIYNEKIRKH